MSKRRRFKRRRQSKSYESSKLLVRVPPSPPIASPQESPFMLSPTERRLVAVEVRLSVLTKQVDELEKLADQLLSQRGNARREELDIAGDLSIEQFCQRNSISRSFFYALRREGHSPHETRIGRRHVRISHEAEREWRAKMKINPGNNGDKG